MQGSEELYLWRQVTTPTTQDQGLYCGCAASVVTERLMLGRVLHLIPCSVVIILKILIIFNKEAHISILLLGLANLVAGPA